MNVNCVEFAVGRRCFREPIPEIAEAAAYLDEAVTAHLTGQRDLAERLIQSADLQAIRDWVESLWGKHSPYIQFRVVDGSPSLLRREERVQVRMPSHKEQYQLHLRDGYHCRFCGVPVIRKEIRDRLRALYPNALQWGRTNRTQHAAFQAMWAQYDHLLPHARGGDNELENVVVTCAPCNYGRMNYTLEEVGLADPRLREPIHTTWDGLERLFQQA